MAGQAPNSCCKQGAVGRPGTWLRQNPPAGLQTRLPAASRGNREIPRNQGSAQIRLGGNGCFGGGGSLWQWLSRRRTPSLLPPDAREVGKATRRLLPRLPGAPAHPQGFPSASAGGGPCKSDVPPPPIVTRVRSLRHACTRTRLPALQTAKHTPRHAGEGRGELPPPAPLGPSPPPPRAPRASGHVQRAPAAHPGRAARASPGRRRRRSCRAPPWRRPRRAGTGAGREGGRESP